ncbi:unnamed protein product [Owenia fusiformis]|uniref:Uncharacterized protein n=1 Tax=Owenia fusiformis TaxID=6347 RepID=A0A8J1XSS1_OWEFU|nr:unnamed protein product [Owenia fusiformis]
MSKAGVLPPSTAPPPIPMSPPPNEQSPISPSAPSRSRKSRRSIQSSVEQLVIGNINFAIEMYQEILKDKKGSGNIFFSPISIAAVLSLLYGGARNETEKEMAKVMGIEGIDQKRLHLAWKDLLNTLEESSSDYTIRLANRLYSNKGFNYKRDYMDLVNHCYQADLAQIDFKKYPEQSRFVINAWAEWETGRKIKGLIPAGAISKETILVLVDAIYFKGNWEEQFDMKKTRRGEFTIRTGKKKKEEKATIQVDYMNRTGIYKAGYDYKVEVRVIEIPYLKNIQSMVIILPTQYDSLDKVEEKLTTEYLDAIPQLLVESRINLRLPKFSMGRSVKLQDRLADMGVKDLFDKEKADLSGVTGSREMHVSNMFHKAYIDVNERGAEPTSTLSNYGAEEFDCDHPFFFYIKDNRTGAILFMGRLERPLNFA